MACPNCDSNEFGAQERDGEVVRACDDCGYAEEASAAEVADVRGWTTEEEPTEEE